MTLQPEAPPAPPPPGDVARLKAENEALTAQITNQALRQAAGGLQGREGNPGNVSVIKDASGKVVVTTPEGRTVTIDPAAGLDEDAIQNIIQTSLEPPRIPADPNRGPDPEKIVGMVFSFLFLTVLVISLTRAYGKRAMARAAGGVPPEIGARLARIEQAMEAVAIEVERISESERYSARLLTERLPERVPAGPNGLGQPAPTTPTLDAVR